LRLLVLGVDCMTADIVRRFPQSVPFVRELLEGSEWGTLTSIACPGERVPHTGPAWASIYTGVPPEQHGITYGGWLLEHANFADIRTITCWEIMQEHMEVGLFTMPTTFPPPHINGWVVSGFPTPPDVSSCVWPDALKAVVPSDFRLDFCDGREPEDWRENGISVAEARRIVNAKVELVDRIASRFPVDVLAVGFTMVDRFHHAHPLYPVPRPLSRVGRAALPQNSRAVRAMAELIIRAVEWAHAPNGALLAGYSMVDSAIRALCERFAPQSVAIVSDHGAQKLRGHHDFGGFYCFRSDSATRRGEGTRSVTEVAGALLGMVDIAPNELGTGVVRARTESGKEHREHVADRLAGLGYL